MSISWIGFDLDGTLAYYDKFKGVEHIGEPIAPMVKLLKYYIDHAQKVKIFTARVCNLDGKAELATKVIKEWCRQHIGQELEVTCTKDFNMIRLYDDRCVQVIANEGKFISCDDLDPKHIMGLANKAMLNSGFAVQNAERGEAGEKAVIKFQKLAEESMQELADYLRQPRY